LIHIKKEENTSDDRTKLVSKRESIHLLGLEFSTSATTTGKAVSYPVIEKFRRYQDTSNHQKEYTVDIQIVRLHKAHGSRSFISMGYASKKDFFHQVSTSLYPISRMNLDQTAISLYIPSESPAFILYK
jgi:hypothetical protein